MSGDVVTHDGLTYVVTFDGAHRGCDADLLRPVDWQDPKSPWLPKPIARQALATQATPRKFLQRWRQRYAKAS